MKTPRTFRLSDSTDQRLQDEADLCGVTRTALVEMALRIFLNKREEDRLREERKQRREDRL